MIQPGNLFQYQGRTDPIHVPAAAGVTWAFQDPMPVRRDRRRSAALMAAVIAFVPVQPEVSVASWHQPHAMPTVRRRLHQDGGAVFVPGKPEPIAWLYEQQKPRLTPPRSQPPSFFAPENSAVAQNVGWFQASAREPRRPSGIENLPTIFAPLLVELPTLAWMQEPQRPIRRAGKKAPWELTWCPFSPPSDTPGSVAAWAYWPQRPCRRLSAAHSPAFFFVQALEFSDAWRPLVELPRGRQRLVNAQWCFLPESFNISQLSWLQPLSIPTIIRRRPIDWGFQTDFFPAPVQSNIVIADDGVVYFLLADDEPIHFTKEDDATAGFTKEDLGDTWILYG